MGAPEPRSVAHAPRNKRPDGHRSGAFKLPGSHQTGLSLLLHAAATALLFVGSIGGGLLLIGDFFERPSTHPGVRGVAEWGNVAGALVLMIGVPLAMVREPVRDRDARSTDSPDNAGTCV